MRSPPGRPQRAGGVVLLTDGGTLPTAVANFLAARSTQAFAIGGQAAAVDSSAAAVTGADRYATAAIVAAKFFTAPTSVGLPSAPGSLTLCPVGRTSRNWEPRYCQRAPSALSSTSATYLASVRASVRTAFIFGGTSGKRRERRSFWTASSARAKLPELDAQNTTTEDAPDLSKLRTEPDVRRWRLGKLLAAPWLKAENMRADRAKPANLHGYVSPPFDHPCRAWPAQWQRVIYTNVDTAAMSGCCGPDDYQSVFSGRFARRQSRRYRRRGLTPAAWKIVDFVTSRGIAGATVLEIGGGVGQIQVELLRRGASHVTNLEISQNYEAEAARLLAEAEMTDRVTRRFLDIAQAPDAVESADVVVLHRVVCCYPDYNRLLSVAADHARKILVYSHPAANAFNRLQFGAENVYRRLTGNDFRAFIHPPKEMIRAAESDGLAVTYRQHAWDWDVVGLAR